jgi:hypothetical protein
MMNDASDHDKDFFKNFNHDKRSMLASALSAFRKSEDVFRWFRRLRKNPNHTQILSFLRKLRRKLHNVSVGESLVLPATVEGNEIVLIFERTANNTYDLIVVNTDPKEGLRYHPVQPAAPPSGKLKFRTCIVLRSLQKRAALDDVFWMGIYNMVQPKDRDTYKFYDVLLPFLTGKPLESSLAEEDERISSSKEKTKNMAYWRSPQKARTASLRSLLEAMHYLLRRQGLSQVETKQVALGLRVQFVKMMFHDLQFIPLDSDSRHLIAIATRQLAYCTFFFFFCVYMCLATGFLHTHTHTHTCLTY